MKNSTKWLGISLILACVLAQPCLAEWKEAWGERVYYKTVSPIELSLDRGNVEIDTISVPVGAPVSVEIDDNGLARAYWMGEEFSLPWNALAPLNGDAQATTAISAPTVEAEKAPVNITIEGKPLENVVILKDFPKSL
jgi:hypothetical protein